MFEQQYRELWAALDPMAERIRALGHRAPQSYAEIAASSRVSEAKGEPSAAAMITELLQDHETVIAGLRDALALAQDARDEASAGLVSSRLDAHEKTAWMLAAAARG
jgi:starvation-inducible DNA-binding protein